MKAVVCTLGAVSLLVLSLGTAFGTFPGATISYQGYLEETGTPVNGVRDLGFMIYDAAEDGTLLWSEDHEGVTVTDGIFEVYLGDTDALDALAFDEQYWLALTVGEGPELTPRTMLAASPYSMSAGGGGGEKSIWLTADSFSHGDVVVESVNGLRFPTGHDGQARALIPMPADWDGTSDFRVVLKILPATSADGLIDFFVRVAGRSLGEILSDPGSSGAPGVNTAEITVKEQEFVVSASRFDPEDDFIHIYAIQRGATGETYGGSVYLLAVEIKYMAAD